MAYCSIFGVAIIGLFTIYYDKTKFNKTIKISKKETYTYNIKFFNLHIPCYNKNIIYDELNEPYKLSLFLNKKELKSIKENQYYTINGYGMNNNYFNKIVLSIFRKYTHKYSINYLINKEYK